MNTMVPAPSSFAITHSRVCLRLSTDHLIKTRRSTANNTLSPLVVQSRKTMPGSLVPLSIGTRMVQYWLVLVTSLLGQLREASRRHHLTIYSARNASTGNQTLQIVLLFVTHSNARTTLPPALLFVQ